MTIQNMTRACTLFFMAASLLLVGCQNHQNTPTPSKSDKQMIRLNIEFSPASLHPHTGVDVQCRHCQKPLFECLTRINLKGEPELAAAESVIISSTQTHYTFTLRPHKWTNGEAVTAYHFEKAWKAAIAPASPCLRAELFYPIKNALQAKEGKVPLDVVGIYATDPQTLIVELEHPSPYFLDLIANPLFAPLYDEASVPTIFNGPFRLALFEHDNKMILEKNPDYWDAAHIALDQVHISFLSDATTVVMLYEKGELDWVGHPFTHLPRDALPHLEKSKDFHCQPVSGVFWLFLNVERFPLNSCKIRRALSVAINRQSIAQHVLQGETPTKHMLPPIMDPLSLTDLYPDDNQKLANALFQEGLQELNLTLAEFPILTFSHSDVYGQNKIAEAIQQCWEKTFGIKVHLQQNEWNTHFANLGQRQFQIGGCIWFTAYNDPTYFLEFFKNKNHRCNASQWENTHYQQLLHLIDTETDLAVRTEHIKQAEMVIMEEMPIIPLFVFNAKYLKRPFIKGLEVSDLGMVDFRWASIITDTSL